LQNVAAKLVSDKLTAPPNHQLLSFYLDRRLARCRPGVFWRLRRHSIFCSAAAVGIDAFEVEIEVHAGWGNTDKIAVVGLPDTAVKESKDRVTSATCNSGLRWPYGKRITTNLAPADVRKEGPSFDLPIALGMLKLRENNRLPDLDAFYLTGELALSGQLRPVKGVLSIALEAKGRHR
jgi:magnesium chelatase family protein